MRRISGIVFFMFVLFTANAQQFRVGVNTGVDAARLKISGAEGGVLKYKTELTGGVSFEAVFSPLIALQLEGNYSQQGTGVINDDASTAGSYGLDYITVPLLVKLSATPHLSFYAGPQVGFLIKARLRSNSSPSLDVKDQLEKTSYYGVLGTEYRFTNGVTVGARYNTGFDNISKVGGASNLKNSYFSFRVGYSFSLK